MSRGAARRALAAELLALVHLEGAILGAGAGVLPRRTLAVAAVRADVLLTGAVAAVGADHVADVP